MFFRRLRDDVYARMRKRLVRETEAALLYGLTFPDRVPRIQRLGPMGYSIFGYNGRGIAPGTALGRAFAEYAATRDERAFPLVPVDEARAPPASGALELAYDAGAVAYHWIDAR